jgi:hypothetical protein
VSPALAFSTISCRKMTSRERGSEPAGISFDVSCILTLCQSVNLLSWRRRAHFDRFWHVALTHMIGYKQTRTHHETHLIKDRTKRDMVFRGTTSVYLNCCSTFFTTFPQSRHLKVPCNSSGRTSLVRVTTPITDVSLPISAVPSSLSLQ